jgi:hypothetical protein
MKSGQRLPLAALVSLYPFPFSVQFAILHVIIFFLTESKGIHSFSYGQPTKIKDVNYIVIELHSISLPVTTLNKLLLLYTLYKYNNRIPNGKLFTSFILQNE